VVIVLSALVSACGLTQLSPSEASGSEDQALALDREVLGLTSNNAATHTQLEYARATVWGTSKASGDCRTYEVLPIVKDITRNDAGGQVDSQFVWVRVREFCCERRTVFTEMRGRVNLDDSEYNVTVQSNKRILWSAMLNKTVTVSNTSTGDELTLDLNLDWTGIYDIRNRNENRWFGEDLDNVSSYTLTYEMTKLGGWINVHGQDVTFNFDEDVVNSWIGDMNRTSR
jgi:hypothetical protein